MSADEIRGLADYIRKYRANSAPQWSFGPIADKSADALLAYAAMVERCEEIKAEQPFDSVINTANYILKGAKAE